MPEPVIEWIASPWHSKGWFGVPTSIAYHSTAGSLASTLATFGPGSSRKVSAHFTVDGFSGRIIQHVSLDDRAWHAMGANEFAVGVEHVDNGPWGWHPELTYELSAWLTRVIATHFGISIDEQTCGPHSRWVPTACPARLDWSRIVYEASGGGDMAAFDPRNVPADLNFLDARIREIVLGEPQLTASALKRALGTHYALKAPTKKQLADARKGHGRGKSKDVK